MYFIVQNKKGYKTITPCIDNMFDYLLNGYVVLGFSETMVGATKIKKGEIK